MTRFRGALLRALIQEQNLRLEEVAVMTGLSWMTIYRLTRDASCPSQRTLGLLADALNCSVGDLFADDAEAVPR